MPIAKATFFALWKYTFQCQLRVLYERLGKAACMQNEIETLSLPCGGEFEDFCLYVYDMCPELIDLHQN